MEGVEGRRARVECGRRYEGTGGAQGCRHPATRRGHRTRSDRPVADCRAAHERDFDGRARTDRIGSAGSPGVVRHRRSRSGAAQEAGSAHAPRTGRTVERASRPGSPAGRDADGVRDGATSRHRRHSEGPSRPGGRSVRGGEAWIDDARDICAEADREHRRIRDAADRPGNGAASPGPVRTGRRTTRQGAAGHPIGDCRAGKGAREAAGAGPRAGARGRRTVGRQRPGLPGTVQRERRPGQ